MAWADRGFQRSGQTARWLRMGRPSSVSVCPRCLNTPEHRARCSAGAERVVTRCHSRAVSVGRIGSANGDRTRRLPVQLSPVGFKWLCFLCGWYSGMLRNTAMNRRRHSASVGRGRALTASAFRKLPFSDPGPGVARQNRICGFSDRDAFIGPDPAKLPRTRLDQAPQAS
jgi:hypothetical protein